MGWEGEKGAKTEKVFLLSNTKTSGKTTNTRETALVWKISRKIACIIIKIVSTFSTISPFFFFGLLLFYGIYWLGQQEAETNLQHFHVYSEKLLSLAEEGEEKGNN
jgi:hypothetical protein